MQIVRVPRYSSLTVNSGDTITGDTWDSTQGGQLGPRAAGTGDHGGRFRGAGRLPPPAPLSPVPRQDALEKSELGALLVFDVNNIRYITSTKIGEWERDKLARWALLTRTGEPILWDFGSAAVHHKL